MEYNFFDKIICINLKYRKDRYISATKEFDKLNIKNVEFYFADKSPKGGRYGCFESHINVIRDCYYKNYNYILIFEDDLRLSKYYNINLLNLAIDFMKNNTWDIFYLGFIITRINIIFDHKLIYNNIIKYNPHGGHAYCLNQNSMYKILSTYTKFINKYQIDQYYSLKNLFNNYCIIPLLFEQYYCYDIDNTIHSSSEYIYRQIQCIIGDYLNINSNTSYLIYIYNYYKIKYIIFLLIFILFILYQI